jgi:hypothetical protein
MKSITLKQAKQLKVGTILYQSSATNADGTPARWRITGEVKTWKRNPEKISVPMKHGMYLHSHLNEMNLEELSLIPYLSKRFTFGSAAKSFQRKKRIEGFKTQLDVHSGIAFPFVIVKWMKRPDSMPLNEICTPSSF